MSDNSAKKLFKVIMGVLIIAFVLLTTIKYLKVLPPVMKILALAVNAATFYLSYIYLIRNKKDK